MNDYEETIQSMNKEIANNFVNDGFIGKTKLTDLQKVEGKDKYSGKNLTTAAKNIKKIIKDMYPDLLMVKITSSRFSGGDSIHAHIVYDINSSKEEVSQYQDMAVKIDHIISVFSDSGFDSMTDSSFSLRNEINENYGSAKDISCGSRSYDPGEKESFSKKKITAERKALMKITKEEKKELTKIIKQGDSIKVKKKRL